MGHMDPRLRCCCGHAASPTCAGHKGGVVGHLTHELHGSQLGEIGVKRAEGSLDLPACDTQVQDIGIDAFVDGKGQGHGSDLLPNLLPTRKSLYGLQKEKSLLNQ